MNQREVSAESVVSLREVISENLYAVCKLSKTLSPAHQGMVAENAFSIAEAHYSKHAWYRAIYADDTPVGFLMLHNSLEDKPGYFLWRLMIGGNYQGMGFGRRAVELLIDHVRTMPGAAVLKTSCGLGEGSPLEFYHKLGFKENGEFYGDEDEEIGLCLPLV